MQLNQKIIVISGGTSGIGTQMVDQLASNNTLVVIARNESKLNALVKIYPEVIPYTCNLANLDDVANTADLIAKNHPEIDLLINNAAVQFAPKFLDDDFRYETIQQEVNVNFTSIFSLIYLLLPCLLDEQRRAIILNVNSGLALAPKTSSAIYCATKGGLNIFSQSLRYQFESTNIRVLQAIMPLVDTAMTTGRGSGKISANKAATDILYGIEKEIAEHYIGKAKLLKLIYRLSPTVAKRILKRS